MADRSDTPRFPESPSQDAVDRAREKGLAALSRGDRPAARKHLRQAIRLCETAGDAERLWSSRLALGLTYLRAGGAEACATAVQELSAAARGALAAGAEGSWLRCLAWMAETVATRPEGIDELQALVTDAGDGLSPAAQQAAGTVLATAQALAGVARGDTGATWAGPRIEALEQALDAPDAGAAQEDGWVRLLMAGRAQARGDLAAAERESSAAKDLALRDVDPVLYAASCGAIARVRDQRGDRVGALTALFSCKASLEDLLGPAAGAQVVLMIDALEARWGARAFGEILAAYRRQFEGGV